MVVRETSLEAYRELEESGALGRNLWEVYRILFHHGPMTSSEIFQFSRNSGNDDQFSRADRHQTSARLNTLRDDYGAVYERCKRPCRVTGRTVIEWAVTGTFHYFNGEREMETKAELRAKVARLESAVVRLQEENQALRNTIRQYQKRDRQGALFEE